MKFNIRPAHSEEFKMIGELMVSVYSKLEGFPKPKEHPTYYEYLLTIGEQTQHDEVALIVAATLDNSIAGAVVYMSNMAFYGAGGTATQQKNASGFRLLTVDPKFQGKGIGKMLSQKCIEMAKAHENQELIIHTTDAMKIAWKMYDNMGFKRSSDLDFQVKDLKIYGFRLKL